jgi:hypothetical protein
VTALPSGDEGRCNDECRPINNCQRPDLRGSPVQVRRPVAISSSVTAGVYTKRIFNATAGNF